MGVDIGGTFTDIAVFDEREPEHIEIVKVSTDPSEPDKAVVDGLRRYQARAQRVSLLSHATTVGTNALLTHTGLAKTALITNQGFRDILEIGRQRRPELYNLKTQRPEPLVRRRNRFTVGGRAGSDGSQIEQINDNDLRACAQRIIRSGFEAVAVSLLHSYAYSAHEKRVRDFLREAGFSGHVDVSSEVDPSYREYERTSTTVVNSALSLIVSKYLTRLEEKLRQIGFHCPLYVMKSDGTTSTIAQASQRPISIIESGPAAGVLASKSLASVLRTKKVITFDMGGTTAKAGTIINGRPDLAYEFEAAAKTYHGRSIKGSGYPVRQPFIDLTELSAGGGTIASIDETGGLKVGPESAGAEPGPAAYGKGGRQATVTDANIVAGRINPTQLLRGNLRLYTDLAVEAIGQLSRRLGISVENTAERILRIVNDNVSRALRLVSIERGRDPREYTLISFGGAGPLHACDLAEELGITRIVIPLHPGLFSAFGLLAAELSRTFTQPILRPVTGSIERTFTQLREQARRSLKQEGFAVYHATEHVDLRYQGQAYEITLPYGRNTNLARLFGREHKKLYGYSSNDTVEAVNARLRAVIPTPKARLAKKSLRPSRPPAAISSRRMSLLGDWQKVPVYSRETFWPGVYGKGPCIVEEYDSTTVIGKHWSWSVDWYENLDLTTRSKSQ